MTSSLIKKVCRTCGSENVWKDANARFNTVTQQYELASLFDAEYCDDCDSETHIEEEPLNREGRDAQDHQP